MLSQLRAPAALCTGSKSLCPALTCGSVLKLSLKGVRLTFDSDAVETSSGGDPEQPVQYLIRNCFKVLGLFLKCPVFQLLNDPWCKLTFLFLLPVPWRQLLCPSVEVTLDVAEANQVC